MRKGALPVQSVQGTQAYAHRAVWPGYVIGSHCRPVGTVRGWLHILSG